MTDATIDRTKVLEDAFAIEAAGGQWRMRHVMAVLDCARSTVYNTAWLIKIRKRVGVRSCRWDPKDVRLHQAIASGHNPLKRTGS